MSVEQQLTDEQIKQQLTPTELIRQQQQEARQDIMQGVQTLSAKMPPDKQSINQVAPKMLNALASEGYDMTVIRDKTRVLPQPHAGFGELNLLQQYLVQVPTKFLTAFDQMLDQPGTP